MLIRVHCKKMMWMAAVAAVGISCSNSRPELAGKGGDKAGSGKDQGDDLLGRTGTNQSTGTATAAPTTPELAGCGVDPNVSTGDVTNATLNSGNIRFHGFAGAIFASEYNVVVRGSLAFRGGVSAFSTTSAFDILSADPPNVQPQAEEQIRKVTGSRDVAMVAPKDWPALFANDPWRGIACGVLPATEIREQTGAHGTVVRFNPPLPYLVPPWLTPERFAKEFPSARQFTGVVATVAQTTNPLVSTATQAQGTVTVTPVSPSANITDGDGRTVAVNGSYAFRIEFDFGNHERTAALGLYKVATYFVQGGRYIAITVETGIADAPVVNYFGG